MITKYHVLSIVLQVCMISITLAVFYSIHKNNIDNEWIHINNCTQYIVKKEYYTYVQVSAKQDVHIINFELGNMNINNTLYNYCLSDMQLTSFVKWDGVHYPYERVITLNNLPFLFCGLYESSLDVRRAHINVGSYINDCYISNLNDVLFSFDNLPNYFLVFVIIAVFCAIISFIIIVCHTHYIMTLMCNEYHIVNVNSNVVIDMTKLILWNIYPLYAMCYIMEIKINYYNENNALTTLIWMYTISLLFTFCIFLLTFNKNFSLLQPLIPIYGLYNYCYSDQEHRDKYNIFFAKLSKTFMILHYIPLTVLSIFNINSDSNIDDVIFFVLSFLTFVSSMHNYKFIYHCHDRVYYRVQNEIENT